MNITMHPVESSQIAEIGHDEATNTLRIKFTGRGSVYDYQNFTRPEFEAFMAAKSKGGHFIKNIKHESKKYPYRKVAEEKAAA